MHAAVPRCTIAMVCVLLFSAQACAATARWLGTWGAAPAGAQAPGPAIPPERVSPVFYDQTIQQTLRLSIGGARLRLRLTNAFGATPLTIGAARVTLLRADGSPGESRRVSFSGRASATIPAGAPWLSDEIDLPTPSRARVQVALYLKGEVPTCTCHFTGRERAAVSPPGDYTDRAFADLSDAYRGWRAFLAGVEVEAGDARAPVVVAFGDSITDGTASTMGADRRWPDGLAERTAGRMGVVNAGLGGNRLLADVAGVAFVGPNALARFDSDALAVAGVSHIVVLEGINDIGFGGPAPPDAEALIAAFRQLAERAHARRVKVIFGTLLPYEGAFYYTAEGEVVRGTVNAWLRRGTEGDGLIDFDAAMRDPQAPARMRAEFHSGDWLHPNDAGYLAMAAAIDLGLFQ